MIAVVVSTVFMFAVDYGMLNISLPTISGYFHVNIGKAAMLPLGVHTV